MTNRLILNNDYSYLETEDKVLKNKLWSVLRFREENYFHSRAYKQRLWDGYREFFDKDNGKFLTGLLPEVVYYIKALDKKIDLIDNRGKVDWIYPSINEKFLNQWLPKGKNKIDLYDFQTHFVNQFIKLNRGIIQSPTASGKSNIFLSLIKCLPPKTPTLFLTKRKSLVNQTYNNLMEWGIPGVGRYYGTFKEPNIITCANINPSTVTGLKKLFPHIKALFVDEIHEGMSPTGIKIYSKLKNASIRCAISATAFKFGGKDKVQKFRVKGFFGPIINGPDKQILTTKKLQERNILSKSKATFYLIDKPSDIIYEPYADAVKLGIENNIYFHDVVKRLSSKLNGRTLIVTERIDQGKMLKSLIPEAHWIYGEIDLEEREKVFEELRKKDKVVAIVMQQIITAGIDVFIHNLINAAGSKAEHNIIQRMGRGLRLAPDKEYLDYYDFYFNTNKYLTNHSEKRIKVLTNEGHDVEVKDIDF